MPRSSAPFWSAGSDMGIGSGMGSGSAAGGGVPAGLAAPTIQLAHALQLLGRPAWPGAPDDWTEAGTADRAEPCDDRAEDMADARRLVADALASLAGSAGLSVPVSALVQAPEPEEVDSELESAFVEFDLAREAWRALPGGAETWTTRPEVDRYLAAEDSILAIADARDAVLRRQADLLIDLADDLSDQVGAAAANAIANVAQGLLLRLDR